MRSETSSVNNEASVQVNGESSGLGNNETSGRVNDEPSGPKFVLRALLLHCSLLNLHR